MPVINSFNDLGNAVIESFGDYRHRTAEVLHESLVSVTPEKTGTLKANWKGAPGKTGTDSYIPNTGEKRQRPPRFDTSKYLRNWSVFTIRNNSPYVKFVNDGIRGNQHNVNFIQRGIAKAAVEMKTYVEKRR